MAYAPRMATSTARRLVALAGAGSVALALQVPARADNPTYTKITTPSGRQTVLDRGGADPQFPVSGTASPDITAVNVLCVRGSGLSTDATTLAADVPVTNGSFSATAEVPSLGNSGPICRLRAVPTAVPVTGALSSYAGPLMNLDSLGKVVASSSLIDFTLDAGSGDGEMSVESAGRCGNADMGTVPPDLGRSVLSSACVANLGPGPAAGTTGSLRVDGHLALLPHSVFTFSDPTVSLTLHVHVAKKSGRVTWTESAPLVRCQSTDSYPPPAGQCNNVVEVGVTFTRTGVFDAGGHQIRLRDAFRSSDGHRHRVRTVYGMEFTPPDTGRLGFAFPGRKGFHTSTPGQVVKGLPHKAATVLVRSDIFSREGDPQANTRAVTWSRPPSRLAFTSDASVFGMRYGLDVPKQGSVRLGFTDSDATLTSTARAMGRRAVAQVMSSPTISQPVKGAVIEGTRTVVTGTVVAGVNGLPVSVRVNGHAATLLPKGAAKATYKAVFDESLGKHTITATAKDAGGNKRSTSITVRNK